MSPIERVGIEAARVAAAKIGTGAAVKQLGGNLAQIAKNSGERLAQDHSRMKNNSLIISALVLALSRVFISNLSARKSKGTPDGPLRYREAIRTTIREVCGWTFGYVILRWMQNAVRLGMAHYFGIKDKHGNVVRMTPDYFKDKWMATIRKSETGQALKAAITRQSLSIPKASRRPVGERVFEFTKPERVEQFKNLMGKVLPKVRMLENPEFLQSLYRWAPIIIGSIPAVGLAGYALERFTRDHSDKVVAAVSKRFGGDAGIENTTPQPGQPVPGQGCNAAQGFDSYRARIQQLQTERGPSQPSV